MTKDGAVAENLSTGDVEHISGRQKETDVGSKKHQSSRLQFSQEDLENPALADAIHRSNAAADRLDAVKENIPKQRRKVRQRVYDEAAGRAKTVFVYQEADRPPNTKLRHDPLRMPLRYRRYDTMKAYFYCRVAHDDSFSLEQQAAKLRRYAEQAGYTIVGVAAEHGSGLTLDRPALQELTEAVLAGKVDVVLVNSLDRLGRDWGMTKQYIDLLTEHKVKLLCVRERMMIDSSSFSPFFT